MNGVQTRFKCKLDVKRCKRFVFPPSSLLPRSNALKTKAIRYFQTDRTLTRIVSPPLRQTITADGKSIVNADTRRNNTYLLTIKSFQGLGMPWDPSDPKDPYLPKPDDKDEPTNPENPDIEKEETYMRVEAKVLQWNLVSRDVILE